MSLGGRSSSLGRADPTRVATRGDCRPSTPLVHRRRERTGRFSGSVGRSSASVFPWRDLGGDGEALPAWWISLVPWARVKEIVPRRARWGSLHAYESQVTPSRRGRWRVSRSRPVGAP